MFSSRARLFSSKALPKVSVETMERLCIGLSFCTSIGLQVWFNHHFNQQRAITLPQQPLPKNDEQDVIARPRQAK